MLIWDRDVSTLISKKFYRSNIDYIIRIYGNKRALNYLDGDVLSIYSKLYKCKQGKETIHPTEKPIPLIEKLITISSNNGDVIFDPFLGSATTAIACINTKRNYIGFELDKGYFDIANKRIFERNQQLELF